MLEGPRPLKHFRLTFGPAGAPPVPWIFPARCHPCLAVGPCLRLGGGLDGSLRFEAQHGSALGLCGRGAFTTRRGQRTARCAIFRRETWSHRTIRKRQVQ